MKNQMKRTSKIEVDVDGNISFSCTSELYETTLAGGNISHVLPNKFISLGDGNDYILSKEEKILIKNKYNKTKL